MPTAASRPSVWWACSYMVVTVSPRTWPWSATASRVASGIVLTTPAATSSITYRVSSYAGSFTPVEAHSGRCGLAPAASSAFHRSEANTFS